MGDWIGEEYVENGVRRMGVLLGVSSWKNRIIGRSAYLEDAGPRRGAAQLEVTERQIRIRNNGLGRAVGVKGEVRGLVLGSMSQWHAAQDDIEASRCIGSQWHARRRPCYSVLFRLESLVDAQPHYPQDWRNAS